MNSPQTSTLREELGATPFLVKTLTWRTTSKGLFDFEAKTPDVVERSLAVQGKLYPYVVYGIRRFLASDLEKLDKGADISLAPSESDVQLMPHFEFLDLVRKFVGPGDKVSRTVIDAFEYTDTAERNGTPLTSSSNHARQEKNDGAKSSTAYYNVSVTYDEYIIVYTPLCLVRADYDINRERNMADSLMRTHTPTHGGPTDSTGGARTLPTAGGCIFEPITRKPLILGDTCAKKLVDEDSCLWEVARDRRCVKVGDKLKLGRLRLVIRDLRISDEEMEANERSNIQVTNSYPMASPISDASVVNSRENVTHRRRSVSDNFDVTPLEAVSPFVSEALPMCLRPVVPTLCASASIVESTARAWAVQEAKVCRFCLGEEGEEPSTSGAADVFLSPCECRGSLEWIHAKCLQHWVFERLSHSPDHAVIMMQRKHILCELCHQLYSRKLMLNILLREKGIQTAGQYPTVESSPVGHEICDDSPDSTKPLMLPQHAPCKSDSDILVENDYHRFYEAALFSPNGEPLVSSHKTCLVVEAFALGPGISAPRGSLGSLFACSGLDNLLRWFRDSDVSSKSVAADSQEAMHIVTFEKNKIISVGRGHDCSLRVNDISVSRTHAELEYDTCEHQLYITDKESKFGTCVAFTAPIRRPVGQSLTLQLGSSVFTIEVPHCSSLKSGSLTNGNDLFCHSALYPASTPRARFLAIPRIFANYICRLSRSADRGLCESPDSVVADKDLQSMSYDVFSSVPRFKHPWLPEVSDRCDLKPEQHNEQ